MIIEKYGDEIITYFSYFIGCENGCEKCAFFGVLLARIRHITYNFPMNGMKNVFATIKIEQKNRLKKSPLSIENSVPINAKFRRGFFQSSF